jgi:hypothetical protein
MPIVKAPRAQLCDQIVGLSRLIAADLPKGEPGEEGELAEQLDDSTEDPEIGETMITTLFKNVRVLYFV